MTIRSVARLRPITLAIALLPGSAFAQSMPAAGTVVPPNSGPNVATPDLPSGPANAGVTSPPSRDDQPADIVVTGTSHNMLLQKAPVAVSAFTAHDIERAGISTPQSFLALTPNVSFNNSMQSESQITVRGIAQTNKPGSNSPVAVVIDGVPIQDASEFVQGLYDIEQIEVLKGPQSALYGRNAIAGAIVINTKEPPTSFGGSAVFGASNGGGLKGQVTVGGPLIEDKLRFQLVAAHDHMDGLFTNVVSGRKVDFYNSTNLRGRLLFTPTDRLKIDVKAETSWGDNGSFQYVGLLASNPFDPHPTVNVNDRVPYTPDLKGVYSEKRWKTSAHTTYDLGDATLSATTAYSFIRWRSRGSQYPYLPAADGVSQGTQAAGDTNRSFFQDLRITSGTDRRLRYVFGTDIYIYSQRLLTNTGTTSNHTLYHDVGPYAADSENPTTSYSDDFNKTKAFGVFGDLTYDLTDALTADLAVRYDYAHVSSRNDAPPEFTTTSGLTRKTSFDQVQPKFTLSYKMTPDVMVFADYGRGFLAGGFNVSGARETIIANGQPNTTVQNTYPAETADSFEAGFKSQWFDKRLTLNASFYYNLVHNQQLYQFLPSASLSVIDQIDRTRLVGGEIELDYRFLPGWDLQGGMGYTDATITKYPGRPDTVGNRVPQVPKWSLSAAVNHEFKLTDHLKGFARVEDTFRGSQTWESEEWPGYTTKSVNLVNLRLGLTYDSWSLTGYVKNLTNRKYTENVTPIFQTAAAVFYGQPRLYGLELAKRF